MFKSNKTGFAIKFANGNTISVQWGDFNYATPRKEGAPTKTRSNTAEMAAWPANQKFHIFPDGDQVAGWQTPEKVLEFMNFVANNTLNTAPTTPKDTIVPARGTWPSSWDTDA